MLEKLQNLLEERQEQLKDSLAAGNIQSFESYQKIVGEITGLSFAIHTIRDLHKAKAQGKLSRLVQQFTEMMERNYRLAVHVLYTL